MGKCGSRSDGFERTPVLFLVSHCLHFVATLTILIVWLVWRRKNKHVNTRQLLGPVYGLVLIFQLIGLVLNTAATLVVDCAGEDRMGVYRAYFSLAIAFTIFYNFSRFLLLVLVAWGLNTVLRNQLNQLGNNRTAFWKTVYGVVLGVAGMLMLAYTGLLCYMYGRYAHFSWAGPSPLIQAILGLTYWILYLLVLVGFGTMSFVTLMKLRRSQGAAKSLLPLIITLHVSMIIWATFHLVESIGGIRYYSFGGQLGSAFTFVEMVFQVLSYVMILLIGKSAAFENADDESSDQHPVLNE